MLGTYLQASDLSQPIVTSSPTHSKAVKLAAPANHDMALATFKDECREHIVALFTLVTATSPIPNDVGALMVLYQVASLLLNEKRAGSLGDGARDDVSVYNCIRSAEKAMFVPLWAAASLPCLATDVAKLSMTHTS